MRTITLELLRHGPANNQLLSPLTPYLALCDSQAAVTLQLKEEHAQWLHRLRALSYRLGEETRLHQVQDSARLLGDLLAQIPGLAAVLGPGQGSGAAEPIHLRLVLSASELALLPFELALAPPAWPGGGQPALLQPQQPLCITRETRRSAGPAPVWPQDTRVLVVLAAPAGLPAVPALAHLVALRDALAAWVGSAEGIGQHLTVLSDASLLDVQRACAEQPADRPFTHVHILAHGGERTEGFDTRFGLMLHNPADPQGAPDIVSGERLASALRAVQQDGRASHPAVVTLASCNSGAVGGVTGLGGSIAHALHQAGIPMVIASQFPLSFGGSVRMVQTLYQGLLWGEDPRRLLVALRRQLHAEFPDTADWASLTAYTALPADFEQQLANTQIQRAMTAINVVMTAAEAAATAAAAPDNTLQGLLAARIQQGKNRLRQLLKGPTTLQAKALTLLASTEKREAGLQHVLAGRALDAGQTAQHADHLARMWAAMGQSRRLYLECWHLQRSHYITTQVLSLGVVLQAGGQRLEGASLPGRQAGALWHLAEVQAQHELERGSPQEQVWALGSLTELYLLAPALPELAALGRDWPALAQAHASRLLDTVGADDFELLSTRRQLNRYLQWYAPLGAGPTPPPWLDGLKATAQAIVAQMPQRQDAPWDYARG